MPITTVLDDDAAATTVDNTGRTGSGDKVYNIVHLIYRARNYEGPSKDYEFSQLSMQDHWRAGYHDALRTLRH